MCAGRNSENSKFRREPGDWSCKQCNEINFKSRTDCRRCSAPRNQNPGVNQNTSASSNINSQEIQRQGDWKCPSCNNLNFAFRTSCQKCAREKPTSLGTNAALLRIAPKPGDWTCSSCSYNNFASRTTCYKCNLQKVQPMETDSPPTITPKPGDWKCPSCPELNFGSRIACRACGAARPSNENSDSSNNECVICMDKRINTVITICGHSAVCVECGAEINQCPICRNPFTPQQIIKVFNVH